MVKNREFTHDETTDHIIIQCCMFSFSRKKNISEIQSKQTTRAQGVGFELH